MHITPKLMLKIMMVFTVSDGSQLSKSDLRAPEGHIQNLSELSYSFSFPCLCHMVLFCCPPHQNHLHVFFFFLAHLPSLNDNLSVYLQSVFLIKFRYARFWCSGVFYFDPLMITFLNILIKIVSKIMSSQCYETHVCYCWLPFYSGTDNYIMISIFISCMCHKSLHSLHCLESS